MTWACPPDFLRNYKMQISEATIGTRVKTLRAFSGVPQGTEGVIDEDYGTGLMVAWDFPDKPLPKNYQKVLPMIRPGILRDGFDKGGELQFLEVVK